MKQPSQSATPEIAGAPEERGLVAVFVGDGRPLLLVGALLLIIAGILAIALTATGYLLPHDAATIGMQATDLCGHHDCRIVNFMIHDRVAFGGALIACGLLYLWLIVFPLAERRRWAWWTLLLSSIIGFLSFLSYVGYGYLDSWHGVATLGMLPFFGIGLAYTYHQTNLHVQPIWRSSRWQWWTPIAYGRLLLIGLALGLIGAGLTITTIGASMVFVPQDLVYLRATVADLHALSHQLIPVIAHDRAGFGGALWATGTAMLGILLFAPSARHLWQIIGLAGAIGFGPAVIIHWLIGYTDWVHLLPAYTGVWVLAIGMLLIHHGRRYPSKSVTPNTNNAP